MHASPDFLQRAHDGVSLSPVIYSQILANSLEIKRITAKDRNLESFRVKIWRWTSRLTLQFLLPASCTSCPGSSPILHGGNWTITLSFPPLCRLRAHHSLIGSHNICIILWKWVWWQRKVDKIYVCSRIIIANFIFSTFVPQRQARPSLPGKVTWSVYIFFFPPTWNQSQDGAFQNKNCFLRSMFCYYFQPCAASVTIDP